MPYFPTHYLQAQNILHCALQWCVSSSPSETAHTEDAKNRVLRGVFGPKRGI